MNWQLTKSSMASFAAVTESTTKRGTAVAQGVKDEMIGMSYIFSCKKYMKEKNQVMS